MNLKDAKCMHNAKATVTLLILHSLKARDEYNMVAVGKGGVAVERSLYYPFMFKILSQ